jgi:hypothetical protein
VAFRIVAQHAPVVIDEGNAAVSADGSGAVEGSYIPANSRHARPMAEGDAITIKVYASVGPLTSSPDFSTFASDFLNKAYSGNILPGPVSTTAFSRVGPKFEPSWLMGGKTIWFATVMERVGKAFLPTNLTSQITSWPNNLFNKLELFTNTNFVYAGTSRGEITESNGSKTLFNGGRWIDQPVTKFAFLGTANKTMNANSQAEMDSNSAWMMGFPNFTIECQWAIKENGAIVGIGNIVLETKPEIVVVTPPHLNVVRDAAGKVKFTSPDLIGSASIEATDSIKSPVWTGVSILNGQTPTILNTDGATKFFRLRIIE